jgi:hypothetical protein
VNNFDMESQDRRNDYFFRAAAGLFGEGSI